MSHQIRCADTTEAGNVEGKEVHAEKEDSDAPGWDVDGKWEEHEGGLGVLEDYGEDHPSPDCVVTLERPSHPALARMVEEQHERPKEDREEACLGQEEWTFHHQYALTDHRYEQGVDGVLDEPLMSEVAGEQAMDESLIEAIHVEREVVKIAMHGVLGPKQV